jgi:hypothetical protein
MAALNVDAAIECGLLKPHVASMQFQMWSDDMPGRKFTRPVAVTESLECGIEMLNVVRKNMVRSA